MAAQLPTLAGGKDSLLKFTGDKLSPILGADAWKYALFDDTPIMNAAFDLVGGFGSMMMKSIFGSDENAPGAAPVTQQSGPTSGAGENAEVNQELDVQTDIMQETLGVTYNILEEVSGNRFEEIERERERLRRERIKGRQPIAQVAEGIGHGLDTSGFGMSLAAIVGGLYAAISAFIAEAMAQMPKWTKIPNVIGRYGTKMPGSRQRIGMARAISPRFMGHVDTYSRWVQQNNAYWDRFSRVFKSAGFRAFGGGRQLRGSVQARDMVKMLKDWPRIQSLYISSATRMMAALEAIRIFGQGIGPNSEFWKWVVTFPKTLHDTVFKAEKVAEVALRDLNRVQEAARAIAGSVQGTRGIDPKSLTALGNIGNTVKTVIQAILAPFKFIFDALNFVRKSLTGIGKWAAKTLGFAVKKILLPFFMIKDAREEFTRSGNFANAIVEAGRTFIEFWYGALVDLVSDGILWLTKQAMKLFGAGPETLRIMDQLIEFDFAKFFGEVVGQIWASLYNTIAQGANAIIGMFTLGIKTDLVPYVNPETGKFAGENEAPIKGEGWLGAPSLGHGYGEKEINRAFPQLQLTGPKPSTIGTLDPGAAGGNVIVLGRGRGRSETPATPPPGPARGSTTKVRNRNREKQVLSAITGDPGYDAFGVYHPFQ